MKRVAILQSNFIPWRGYFDLIAAVDEFIFYDDAQYTKNDWRNRNRIKTPQGAQWLTIPVGDAIHRPIRAVEVVVPDCGAAHWKRLVANYRRARHFDGVAAWLQPLYDGETWSMLSIVNQRLVAAICDALGIRTRLARSSDYVLAGDRNERLVALCVQAGATVYLSGPAARSYLDEAAFASAGIEVRWFDYAGYREYPQLWGSFVPDVSIVDLLFNCGRDARAFMKFDMA
jgi:hypothetical protein